MLLSSGSSRLQFTTNIKRLYEISDPERSMDCDEKKAQQWGDGDVVGRHRAYGFDRWWTEHSDFVV